MRRTQALREKNAERIEKMTAQAEELAVETEALSKKIADYEYQTGIVHLFDEVLDFFFCLRKRVLAVV